MTGLLTIEGEENAQNPIISTLRLDDCTSHYSSQPISLGRVWPILKILVVCKLILIEPKLKDFF